MPVVQELAVGFKPISNGELIYQKNYSAMN